MPQLRGNEPTLGLNILIVYMDDILVFSKTEEENLRNLT
jgi:hypothetical protein